MAFSANVERWRTKLTAAFDRAGIPRALNGVSLIDKGLHVIQHESAGDPGAIGDGGIAIGLAQSHYIPKGTSPEQQLMDMARLVAENPVQWTHWGEGVTYQGKPFGALGNVPYRPVPGPASTGSAGIKNTNGGPMSTTRSPAPVRTPAPAAPGDLWYIVNGQTVQLSPDQAKAAAKAAGKKSLTPVSPPEKDPKDPTTWTAKERVDTLLARGFKWSSKNGPNDWGDTARWEAPNGETVEESTALAADLRSPLFDKPKAEKPDRFQDDFGNVYELDPSSPDGKRYITNIPQRAPQGAAPAQGNTQVADNGDVFYIPPYGGDPEYKGNYPSLAGKPNLHFETDVNGNVVTFDPTTGESVSTGVKVALSPAEQAKARADEVAGNQRFTTGERVAGQVYDTGEREASQRFADTNREDTQRFTGAESAADRAQRASEFARSQGFAEEKAAADQALANSRFRAEVLRNPSDILYRMFDSRGGVSPEARFTHADALNGLRDLAPGGRFEPAPVAREAAPFPNPQPTFAPPVPMATGQRFVPPVAALPVGGSGNPTPTTPGFDYSTVGTGGRANWKFNAAANKWDYDVIPPRMATGGMTRASRMRVGEEVDGSRNDTEETIINPTEAPIGVIKNPATDAKMVEHDPFQQTEEEFAAEVAAHKGMWAPEEWKIVEAKRKAIEVKKKRLEDGEPATPADALAKERMPRFALGTGTDDDTTYNYGARPIMQSPGKWMMNPVGGSLPGGGGYYTNPDGSSGTMPGTTAAGNYIHLQNNVGLDRNTAATAAGFATYDDAQKAVNPNYQTADELMRNASGGVATRSRFNQADIVAQARRLSPPGVSAAIGGTRVPTYRPATSGLTLRKIGQLTPGEQEALNSRLGVEFNTTLESEIAGLRSRFGPVVSRPRARLVG